MNDPLINILIRVSKGREEVLKRCLASVYGQTYGHWQIIFSYDDVSCIQMIPDGHKRFYVDAKPSLGPAFYNDYCNELKKLVTDGWFFFLDSDDLLADGNVLENIAKDLRGNAYMAVVCQMSRDGGKVKPSEELITTKQIVSGKIGLPCLFLRAHYAEMVKIGCAENSDYEYIKIVSESVATKFVKKVVVHSPKRSFGK